MFHPSHEESSDGGESRCEVSLHNQSVHQGRDATSDDRKVHQHCTKRSTNIAPTTALAFTMGSGTYCCAVRCRPKREAAVPASDRYSLNWVGESWANIAARPPSACDGHVWSRRIRLAGTASTAGGPIDRERVAKVTL